MAKMENLSIVEEEIFRFIRKSFHLTNKQDIRDALKVLMGKLKKCEGNVYESRSFMYLDIISWLESKIAGRPIAEVIRERRALKKV